jgi:anaerobic C4-dicarboxylate transporter
MADQNRARVGKVLLLSAAGLGVMALGTWVALPPAQSGRTLIAMVLAATAAADALFALFLLTRS